MYNTSFLQNNFILISSVFSKITHFLTLYNNAFNSRDNWFVPQTSKDVSYSPKLSLIHFHKSLSPLLVLNGSPTLG